MKNVFNLVLLLFFTLGCKNTPNTSELFKNIDISHIENEINLSNVSKRVKYVKIEDDEGKIIGSVDKIINYEDKMVLVDKSISKAVFVIDSVGHILCSIDRKGNGPGEYLDIKDVVCANDQIEILDRQGKIEVYDFEGNYLHQISLDVEYGKALCKISGKDYLVYSHGDWSKDGDIERLFFTNEVGKVLSSFLTTNVVSGFVNFSSGNTLWPNGEEIFVSSSLDNSIYAYSNSMVSKRIVLCFEKYSSTESPYNTKSNDMKEKFLKEGGAYYMDKFMITNDLLYFQFLYGSRMGFYLAVRNIEFVAKKFIGENGIMNLPIHLNNNCLYTIIDYSNIKFYSNSNLEPNVLSFGNIAFDANSCFNPLIAIYEL